MKNNATTRQDLVDSRKTLEHIRFLSRKIGGRGSCTLQERKAGDYIADQLRALGLGNVRSENFHTAPSTYWPFALSFTAALTGTLLVLFLGGRDVLILAAILSALGVWGMLAETEFASSWVRWVLPRQTSLNVSGWIAPKGSVRQRVVLCAHLDTHRTPVFYSSRRWHALFSILVGLTFLSMVVGVFLYTIALLPGWDGLRWASLALLPIQIFALGMCVHADFTQFSPGANDNASGVAAVLALVKRLMKNPMESIEVHLAFTGCEEVGARGMSAFLDKHGKDLGRDTVYVVLDEVGLGVPKYLTKDGLLIKHRTHPRALEAARKAKEALPGLKILEEPGLAYTDALQATKRGLIALTLCTIPDPQLGDESHWHRMSDTLENIHVEDIEICLSFVWTLLQQMDRQDDATAQSVNE
jgi:Peptidase family M28